MRAVVQRVQECTVTAGDTYRSQIDIGLLVYLGVSRQDSEKDVQLIFDKIINLRIFSDSNGKMNLSLLDTHTELMVISQFTLLGDARRGRRPSFTNAAQPAMAKDLYELFIGLAEQSGVPVQRGVFAASMKVAYINDGPVTILLDSEKRF